VSYRIDICARGADRLCPNALRGAVGLHYLRVLGLITRCLAWTGVKDSGRGISLSVLGYDVLTRPKSFHLRTEL